MKNNKAITLIALVITIIILLILAGVTVGFAMNGTDLFEKAKLATEKYNNEVDKENFELGNNVNEIDNYVSSDRTVNSNIEKMMFPNLWPNGIEQEFGNGTYGVRKEGLVSSSGESSEEIINLGSNYEITGIVNAGGFFNPSYGPEALYYVGRSGIYTNNGNIIYLGNKYEANTPFNIWVIYTKKIIEN